MKWFKNMRIKMKLVVAFLVVIFLTIVVAVVGIIGINNSGNTYGNLIDYTIERYNDYSEANFQLMTARRDFSYILGLAGQVDTINTRLSSGVNAIDLFIEALQRAKANLLSDPNVDPAAKTARSNDIDGMISGIIVFRDEGLRPFASLMMDPDVSQEDALTGIGSGTAMASPIVDMIEELQKANAETVETEVAAAEDLEAYMLILLIAISAVAALLAFVLALYVAGIISKPLIPLDDFMNKAGKTGDITLTPEYTDAIAKYSHIKDETRKTINACAEFVKRVTEISDAMGEVASGNLTVDVKLLSDKDVMGGSLKRMTDNLNAMFGNILSSSSQVSVGSKQVAEGAQSLAQGSTEQAASIQRLSSSISEISSKTKENAEMANKAAELAETIKGNAEKGSLQMEEMIGAVGEINDASQSISKVIKTIDDIAFQTNILALNAAVEAARAGQHGKGFAVVAEEVRNLAAKSAEAAKETGSLIENSKEKANLGVRIAGDTASSLTEIVAGINESDILIGKIARSSEEQALGINQINIGIDQVTQVVQQNSATAEQSAAASEEMNSQSAMLQELISQFKIKGEGTAYRSLQSGSNPANTPALGPATGSFGKY